MKQLEIIDNKQFIPLRDNGGGFLPPKGCLPKYELRPTPKLDKNTALQNFIKRIKMVWAVLFTKSVVTIKVNNIGETVDIHEQSLHVSPINQASIYRHLHIEKYDVAIHKELVNTHQLQTKN